MVADRTDVPPGRPRVLFFLPNVSGYVDRVQLLSHVSDRVGLLILLIGDLDSLVSEEGHPNLLIREVGAIKGIFPLNSWRASSKAARFISERHLDIVHDTFGTLLPLFRRKARYPQVKFVTSYFVSNGLRLRTTWAGSSSFRNVRFLRQTVRMYLGRWLERQIGRATDEVVLQAPGLAEEFLVDLEIGDSDVSVLTNNVDTGFWHPGNRNRSTDGPLRLMFAGGIDRTRGVPNLVDAVAELQSRGVNARLTIAGTWGPGVRTALLGQIGLRALSDVVELSGRLSRTELRDAFRSSDLFVYPTSNEGSPRVVLEALSTGLPVIATRHPGIVVLDPEDQFIEFLDSTNPVNIADKILEAASDSRRLLSRSTAGRDAAVRRFSTEAVADEYANYYGRLVTRRERAAV